MQNIGVVLDTAEINTCVDAISKNVTQSFLKVFSKLDDLKYGFVNKVRLSFTKGEKGLILPQRMLVRRRYLKELLCKLYLMNIMI